MPRSVLLRHDLPDGSWHYDWLIDAVGLGYPDDRTLITFRLTLRPDESAPHFDATRLPDHRRLYVDFEGDLSESRGRITRIADWPCTIVNHNPTAIRIYLVTQQGPVTLQGTQLPDNQATWRFMCHPTR